LILLKSETDTIESLCDPSDNCGLCKSEETYLAESKMLPFQWRQLKFAENCCKQWRLKLMKVAYKLLSRDEATFEELTPSEQKL